VKRREARGRAAAVFCVMLAAAIAAGASAAGCKKGQGAGGRAGAASGAGAKGPPGGGRGGRGKGAPGGGLAFPVDVITTQTKKVEYVVASPGTIEAFERVQVTARVAGAVDKVAFTEGQEVKKGDLLVVIDSARYQVVASSARAAVEKAEAAEKDVEAQIARREGASEKNPGLITGEELSSFKTKGLTAKADTAVARQALRSAQLNVRDANIRAPISGVIQTRTVETGQYVSAGYVMATLLRNDPMLLRFQVAPQEAPRIKPGVIAHFKLRESQRTFSAKITLIAGAADEASRMVNVTGEVIDEGHKFWLRPGSFCDVTLEIGAAREVVVIPITATRPSDHGTLAYVIEGDKAHERVLQIGMHTRDGWIEVKAGLSAGEKLVLRGAEPLSEGSKVRLTEVEPPPGPALPGSAAAEAAASAAAAGSSAAAAPPAPSGAGSGRLRRGPPGGPRAPADPGAPPRPAGSGEARSFAGKGRAP
jgi:membrane fusion protein, multidrug efflux system